MPGPVGVVLCDKPAGPTSREVVDWVRWALGGVAGGHCGTLDPLATGLLVVCVGNATRLSAYLTGVDKRYRATFGLGRSTTTADAAGETVATAACDAEAARRAASHLTELVGPLSLAPPAFSAVKHAGQRAHEVARAGGDPVLEDRTMHVYAVEDVEARGTEVCATFHVSKGTYLRSIAMELGRRASVPAHLAALRRVASGALTVDDARTVGPLTAMPMPPAASGKPRHRIRAGSDLTREGQARVLRAGLIPPDQALPFPRLELQGDPGADALRRLGHGQPIRSDDPGLAAAAPAPGLVGVVGPGPAQTLIVARVEPDGDERAIRPVRTILAP